MTQAYNKEVYAYEVIKSSRVFFKNGRLHLDYRLQPKYAKEENKRTRFSTGIEDTKRNRQRIENNSLELALSHYLENNGVKSPKDIYLKDIALDALNEDRDNRAEDTHQDYLNIYENYIEPIFGGMLITEIKAKDIKVWKNNLLSQKKLSKSRFVKYYRTLNFIINYAYINEYIERNPMDLVDKKSKAYKLPSSDSSTKYYSKAEVKKIIENADGWFKVFMTTLFYSGMRTGEALALKWSDIDFEESTIIIQRSNRHGKIKNTTKTGIRNVIDMALPVKKALKNYFSIAPSKEWVFPNPKTCEPYWEPRSIILYQLKPLLKELKIEYKTLYATRHSFASNMILENVPLTYIQKQLNHKKLSTTMDYYIKNGLINENKKDVRIDTLYV